VIEIKKPQRLEKSWREAIMNHTPGPWRIEYDDLTEEYIVSWETGCATVIGQNRAANAELIAAVPEMLEALEDLLRLTNDQIICKFTGPRRQKALTALAKAYGVYEVSK